MIPDEREDMVADFILLLNDGLDRTEERALFIIMVLYAELLEFMRRRRSSSA